MATRIAESAPAVTSSGWSIDAARALYNVEGWGAGFFDVNDAGHVVVRPSKAHPEHEVDLFEIALDLEEQGISLPVLLRFSDIYLGRNADGTYDNQTDAKNGDLVLQKYSKICQIGDSGGGTNQVLSYGT